MKIDEYIPSLNHAHTNISKFNMELTTLIDKTKIKKNILTIIEIIKQIKTYNIEIKEKDYEKELID